MSIVAPGEYSGFQVMGMIEWGQESKPPKKFPGASNKTLEILLTKTLRPPKNSPDRMSNWHSTAVYIDLARI